MNFKGHLLALCLLLIGTITFAQGQLGVRFFSGIQNQSTASEYLINSGNDLHYKMEVNSISNTQSVGIFSQFNFGYLYVQPEFLYTKYHVTYGVEDYRMEQLTMKNYTERIQQFDIPINAGIRYKNFRFGGGPIFHFVQEINSDIRSLSDISIQQKSLSAGFQGSLGYDWSVFHLDIRYQKDFNSVSDHIYFNQKSVNHKVTPSSLQIGLAVALAKN